MPVHIEGVEDLVFYGFARNTFSKLMIECQKIGHYHLNELKK